MEIVKTLILICSVNLSPADCDSDSARTVLNGPEVASGGLCGLQGQAFLAQSAIGQELTQDEYVKLVCRRSSESLAQAGAPPGEAPVAQAQVPD